MKRAGGRLGKIGEGHAPPCLAVSRPFAWALNSPQFPCPRRKAQTPHIPFLLQLLCPTRTQPAWPSSASLLPASQSLHLQTLLLGSPPPPSRGGWGREVCPNVLPRMPYRLPSTPYPASQRSQRLWSFLCPTNIY